jgi:hypothetical protein
MKVISTSNDYELITVALEKVLNKKKVLPQNVFRQDFKFFLFITFDELFMHIFFNHIKRYLLYIAENSFWLTAIDPDPTLYFKANFDFFGAIEFYSSDSENDYINALNDYPEDSPADALAHNSNLIAIISSTCKWAIYADRNTDIAICAFTNKRQMELFRSIYSRDLLSDLKFAADYAYGTIGNSVLKTEFCSSYMWLD